MLWIKSFHILFVASWFAGLFYLPRIFVNLAQVENRHSDEYIRLLAMAHRLYRFMTILAVPAVVLGLWLWWYYGIGQNAIWMHVKLAAVVTILIYHFYCFRVLKQFQRLQNLKSHVWFRWFNEFPVLMMLLVIIMVVVKPF